MNKKILLSLLIIGIIVSVASAGTWAYFSDAKSTQENTLTAGTLKLNEGITQAKLFADAGYIIPGKSGSDYIYVQNVGTVPGNLYVRISPDGTNKEILDYVTLTVDGSQLTENYQNIGYLQSWDGKSLNIAYSMDTAQTQGQGTTAGFKVDFLLVQDGVTDPTSQLTSSQLNP